MCCIAQRLANCVKVGCKILTSGAVPIITDNKPWARWWPKMGWGGKFFLRSSQKVKSNSNYNFMYHIIARERIVWRILWVFYQNRISHWRWRPYQDDKSWQKRDVACCYIHLVSHKSLLVKATHVASGILLVIVSTLRGWYHHHITNAYWQCVKSEKKLLQMYVYYKLGVGWVKISGWALPIG